jgi:hypothetical protein
MLQQNAFHDFLDDVLFVGVQAADAFKLYRSIEELQADLDDWIAYYNNERTHQGKMCCGRTPMQTLVDGKEAWRDKITTLNS